MAVPVFRNASAKAAGTGAVTPALPASMVADDIVILSATTLAGATLSITANGSISTWTLIHDQDVTGGEHLYVWWGRWSSGTTGPTVTPSSDHCCAGTVAYSGCITDSTVINVAAESSETTSDTSFSFATGISSTVKECMVICVCSSGADSNTGQVPVMANTSLTSLASRLNINTNAGGGGGFGLSEGARSTAGTCGTFTCTLAGSSPKSYIAFALRPVDEIQDKTVSGVARIQKVIDATLSSIARVQKTVDVTTTSVARIQVTQDKTLTAVGNLEVLGIDVFTTSIGRIQKTVDELLTSVARIQAISDQNLTGVARIRTTQDRTTTGIGRIRTTVDKNLTGMARLQTINDGFISCVGRLQVITDRNLTCRGRIGDPLIVGSGRAGIFIGIRI